MENLQACSTPNQARRLAEPLQTADAAVLFQGAAVAAVALGSIRIEADQTRFGSGAAVAEKQGALQDHRPPPPPFPG